METFYFGIKMSKSHWCHLVFRYLFGWINLLIRFSLIYKNAHTNVWLLNLLLNNFSSFLLLPLLLLFCQNSCQLTLLTVTTKALPISKILFYWVYFDVHARMFDRHDHCGIFVKPESSNDPTHSSWIEKFSRTYILKVLG